MKLETHEAMDRRTRIVSAVLLAVATLALEGQLLAQDCNAREIAFSDPSLGDVLQDFLETNETGTALFGQVRPWDSRVGATFAVSLPGMGVWTGARGFSSVSSDPGTEMVTDDLFRVASITKTFVAAVILQLDQEGILDIDDTLETWVPGYFDDQGVKLRHLLQHTSGIYNYLRQDSFLYGEEPATVDEILSVVAERPLEFQPGLQWSYSNTGYILLGSVIEAATGSHWSAEVRQRLLDPLSLEHTFVDGYENLPRATARGYRSGRDSTAQAHPLTADAAGCMVSNAADVLRWFEALLGGVVLDSRHLEMMRTPSRSSVAYHSSRGAFAPFGYGLGLDVFVGESGIAYGHSGYLPGFASLAYHVASQQAGWTLLFNGMNDGPPDPVALALVHCEEDGCTVHDCNGNGVLDECDVVSGFSLDCNGNGKPDACEVEAPQSLRFADRERFEVGSGNSLHAVTSGDIDRDGDQDIVALDTGRDRLTVLRNDGSAGLELVEQLPTGTGVVAVCVVEFGRDDGPELVVVDRTASTVSTLTNSGDGRFSIEGPVGHSVAEGPRSVIPSDLNADEKVDLAGQSAEGVWFLIDSGNGSFRSGSWIGESRLLALAAEDFNTDGKSDLLALTTEALLVLSLDDTGELAQIDRVDVQQGTTAFSSADLNGDTVLDLVTLHAAENSLRIYERDDAGGYVETNYLASGPILSDRAATPDLNSDGQPDLLITERGGSILVTRRNRGNGEFDVPEVIDLGRGNRPQVFHLVDLDGRNGVDIVWPSLRWVAFALNETGATNAGDCDGNGVPDDCDIAAGQLVDANADGIADECESGPSFLRGDCNQDGEVAGTVGDAVFLLNVNFLGRGEPACLAACDADSDGEVAGTVQDAVYLLNFSFQGGPPPGAPFPACGEGTETDVALGCAQPGTVCASAR